MSVTSDEERCAGVAVGVGVGVRVGCCRGGTRSSSFDRNISMPAVYAAKKSDSPITGELQHAVRTRVAAVATAAANAAVDDIVASAAAESAFGVNSMMTGQTLRRKRKNEHTYTFTASAAVAAFVAPAEDEASRLHPPSAVDASAVVDSSLRGGIWAPDE